MRDSRARIVLTACSVIAVTGLIALGVQVALASTGDPKWSVHQKAVASVIEKCYFNGAFNALDADAMGRGFHETFAIFSAKGDELSRYEIADWMAGVRKRKAKPDFDPKSAAMECRIVSIDVTAGAAAAKVEMRRDGRLIYTDYLSLLKFKSGWKISAKIYHRHPDSK